MDQLPFARRSWSAPPQRWSAVMICMAGGAVAALALPSAASRQQERLADPLAHLGRPTFDERFATFDHGVDQQRPVAPRRPHRWRTVYGYGGADAISNRQMSATSFASDKWFSGMGPHVVAGKPLRLDPFVHHRRQLTIIGRPVPSRLREGVWNKPFYGGAITTKFSFAQRFGYFEIVARLPAGKGMWPAFWLMPVDGVWPQAGEIDIVEGLGDPRTIFCTVIAGKTQVQAKVRLDFDASAAFHRYGLLWTPETLTWYVDRLRVAATATPPELRDRDMYMIANLAIGGAWGGYPDAQTRFPARYTIRRITAWPLPQGQPRRAYRAER